MPFDVIRVSGRQYSNADALSRISSVKPCTDCGHCHVVSSCNLDEIKIDRVWQHTDLDEIESDFSRIQRASLANEPAVNNGQIFPLPTRQTTCDNDDPVKPTNVPPFPNKLKLDQFA